MITLLPSKVFSIRIFSLVTHILLVEEKPDPVTTTSQEKPGVCRDFIMMADRDSSAVAAGFAGAAGVAAGAGAAAFLSPPQPAIDNRTKAPIRNRIGRDHLDFMGKLSFCVRFEGIKKAFRQGGC